MRGLIGTRQFYKRLFAILVPILIQNVITNFVSLLDNIMVGQIGTEAMSGVAIVNQLWMVFMLCIFGGISGAGILGAQCYGNGDLEGVRSCFRMKMFIALGATALFYGVFRLFGTQLVGLFLHESEDGLDLALTMQEAQRYLKVALWQMLPFAVMTVYAGTLRETDETLLPMKAGVIAVGVNVVFNYILIFGKLGAPVMGVQGAALATVLARVTEMCIVVWWTHRHSDKVPFAKGLYRRIGVEWSTALKIAKLGMPLLVNEILWSSGMTLLNQCYSTRGLVAVSAVSITSTVTNLFFTACFAMGTAISIMVGQLLGAGETERAVTEDRQLTAFSVALCAVLGIVMACLAPYIPRIYNTTDAVKSMASTLLVLAGMFFPVHAFMNCTYFTLRSGGKTFITFLFDSCFLWAVSIPLALYLSRGTALVLPLLYVSVQAADLIKVAIGAIMLHKRIWVNRIVE